MDTRTVYRYENKYGEGPYQTAEWRSPEDQQRMCDAHASLKHPSWCIDALRSVSRGHLAGCDSREALDAWFDGWHQVLADNGFRVVEYTVPVENVLESWSGLQVAFIPAG